MNQNINLVAAGLLLAAAVSGFGQPAITQQPADQSVSLGANVTNQVRASGTAPLNYRWEFNAKEVTGATNRTLILTNVQLPHAGTYTVVVSDAVGSVASRVATLTVDPTFTKITTGAIVTDLGLSSGGPWGDYNNDGFLDLFVPNGNGDAAEYNFLYRNNGNGSFAKVTSGPPVNIFGDWLSACWGDYNNDGFLDLFVGGLEQRLLYRNDGNGSLTRILTGSVVTDVSSGQGSLGCAWGDYDNDGLLDLFVTTASYAGNAHNFLYRNNGDGTFTALTNSIVGTERGTFGGCAWGDYDNDGYLDLFVSNENGTNSLFHNNGDGTFTKVTTGSIVTDAGHHSGGCAWGDYDNDGFLDLFVANGTYSGSENNFLYHNNGDGTFTRIINGVVANDRGKSISCAWGDYDNDGFLDLFVTNEGGPEVVPTVVNFLYHNNGDGTFTKVTTGSLVNDYSDSFGCSWADYDNDGFLDLFVGRGDNRGNFLYHNNGNSNRWITVKVIGTVSNRSAIGAKIRVEAAIGGVRRRQLREISGGNGCNGQSALWANFGLGDATNIDTVRIEWPSGTVQEFHDVAVKRLLTVTEPPRLEAGGHLPDGSFQLLLTGGVGFRYDIQTSSDLKMWTPWITLTNTNRTMSINDPSTTKSPQQFYRAVGQ